MTRLPSIPSDLGAIERAEARVVRRLVIGAYVDGAAYLRLPDDATAEDRVLADAMVARMEGGRDA